MGEHTNNNTQQPTQVTAKARKPSAEYINISHAKVAVCCCKDTKLKGKKAILKFNASSGKPLLPKCPSKCLDITMPTLHIQTSVQVHLNWMQSKSKGHQSNTGCCKSPTLEPLQCLCLLA